MKKLTIVFLQMFILGVIVNAQPNSFKVVHKKASGTTPTTFSANLRVGNRLLKSGYTSKYNSLQNLKKVDFSTKSTKIKRAQVPIFFERKASNMKSASSANQTERFFNFFEESKNITQISDVENSFAIKNISTDDLGITHYRSVQLHRGIEIYGTESTLHIDAEKERFTGHIIHIQKAIENEPKLSTEQAINNSLEDVKNHTIIRALSKTEKKLLKYEKPSSKLVFFKGDSDNYRLTYEVEVRPNFVEVWKYFIDAKNGEILRKFNATNTDGPATAEAYDLNDVLRTINTYLEDGVYYLYDMAEPMYDADKGDGMILTFDAQNTSTQDLDYKNIYSTNNYWNDTKAVSAHANAMGTYRYFYNTFGRNSINGEGGSILSFINVANSDGSSMDNAFWNGVAAFYGNGGSLKPLAGAQDVIAHELGHGVVSNTANLEYYSQSGAMNEAFADIFGTMVDREDWLMGEDVVKDGVPMRNLADPHNGGTSVFDSWSPSHMTEMVTGEILDNFVDRDNEGVHINCTIPSHAYYLYATAISKDKAEKVFYRALVNYLTKNSQFIDLRVAVIQAAIDLYGNNSTEVTEAASAFDQVGIYGEDPIDDDLDYNVNSGEDFVLSYDTDSGNDTRLYRCTNEGEDFIAFTDTEMKGKVSVVDNGEFAVFVDTDDYIRYIYLDPDNMEEGKLSSDAFWDNAAVSKDGNRLAAISTEIDTSIYVFDLVGGTGMKFKLYNPTTSHDNVEAGGVLYADAIEFDVSGEYLIYDAYNELSSTSSDDISYWDIGFIHVWDNQKNDYGTGTIEKLFDNLPEGVSVGNPVFSKNSPDIIAFDYFDDEDAAIVGANIMTGDLDVIYVHDILGYPSFSKLDDKILFSAMSDSDDEVVGVISLAANKISASGEDAYLLINNAKWPVAYSTGERALGLPPVANFTADYRSGAAPFVVKFIDLSQNDPVNYSWSFEGGNPSVSSESNPVVTFYSTGWYRVDLTVTNNFGSNTLNKTDYIYVSNATKVEGLSEGIIHVYPNPVNDVLHIQSPEIVERFELTNHKGQVVDQKTINDSNFDLDVNDYTTGLYFLKLYHENNISARKIMIND